MVLKLFGQDIDCFKHKWLKYVKSTLDNLGLSYLWLNQSQLSNMSKGQFKNLIKTRIRDQFVTNWRSDVFESDSCVIYRMFKDEFKESAYIKILPKFMVQQMAKFRCRSNKIPVSVFRYDNDLENDKKCTLCNIDTTCDELHLLFQCKFFENERLLYLGSRRFRNISCIFFKDLMENSNAKKLSKISKFMCIIMSIFK